MTGTAYRHLGVDTTTEQMMCEIDAAHLFAYNWPRQFSYIVERPDRATEWQKPWNSRQELRELGFQYDRKRFRDIMSGLRLVATYTRLQDNYVVGGMEPRYPVPSKMGQVSINPYNAHIATPDGWQVVAIWFRGE